MLDVFDFVEDKGGDPKRIRESQRRRHAPEEAVDEVITLYEDQRKSLLRAPQRQWCFFAFTYGQIARYEASQINTKLNATQKEIGLKKKVSGT